MTTYTKTYEIVKWNEADPKSVKKLRSKKKEIRKSRLFFDTRSRRFF